MTLTTESIRVNDIELANEIIWVMNGTAIKQADEIEQLRAENARLTAAHAMQNESLVVLPRYMVNSIEEKLKSLRKFAENCAKLEGQEFQVLVDEAKIALAGES